MNENKNARGNSVPLAQVIVVRAIYVKNIQEVLGRTNSPTFPTYVNYLKCLNLI
jgi:hypothetical protein